MQRLAPKLPQHLPHFWPGPGRHSEAAPVGLVTKQRVAPVREMHAYLMRSARFEPDAYIGVSREPFQHPVMRYGRFAFVCDMHFKSVYRVAADCCVDGATTSGRWLPLAPGVPVLGGVMCAQRYDRLRYNTHEKSKLRREQPHVYNDLAEQARVRVEPLA